MFLLHVETRHLKLGPCAPLILHLWLILVLEFSLKRSASVLIWDFLWVMTLSHQGSFVKDHFFFLISTGFYNMFFLLTKSFSAQSFFFSFNLQGFHCHTVTTTGKTLVISSELLSFPLPCPNYMFLVCNNPLLIIFLSHRDICLHDPQTFTLEGGLLFIKGKVINESERFSTVKRKLVWKIILLWMWNTVFPIYS